MEIKETASKYQTVYDELKREIVSGRLAPGEKMPSELKLMERYDFSRQTIRKALEELTKDGYLHSSFCTALFFLPVYRWSRKSAERKRICFKHQLFQ